MVREDTNQGGDSGIVFKHNLCNECVNAAPFYSIAAGNRNDPATWLDGKIPGENALIIIKHQVVVNQNVSCKTLRIINPGTLTVNPGVQLNMAGIVYTTN